jgi:hypothetical protein
MKRPPLAQHVSIERLRLLPFDFRSDFGSEMETVFREQNEEAQRAGAQGVFTLWWEATRFKV